MTRVAVDPGLCRAYGLCAGIQPDVFDVPFGSPVAVITRDIVGQDDLDGVEEAVRACPAQALTLIGD